MVSLSALRPATSAERRRQHPWRLLAALPIPVGTAVALSLFQRPRPPQIPALPVQVMAAEPVSHFTTTRHYTGEVVAGRSSSLGFELAGLLERVLVEEGDRVVAGLPLARLDSRRLGAQRQQLLAQRRAAQAGVEEVREQLTLAELQRNRRRQLHAQGAISREDLDQQISGAAALLNRLAQAQGQVDDLTARLRQIDVDLARSVIVAPFDGTVSRRLLDEGVVVSGGQAVLALVEAAPREVRVGVPPEVLTGLRVGDSHPLRVGGRPMQGTIRALLPQLEATSRTATLVLSLPETDLLVGETARLSLQRREQGEGFWLPITALVPAERGLWSVYVLGEGDGAAPQSQRRQVARRVVEMVHSEGERALVRGTLRPGERVIASGTQRVVPGQWVVEAL